MKVQFSCRREKGFVNTSTHNPTGIKSAEKSGEMVLASGGTSGRATFEGTLAQMSSWCRRESFTFI